MSLLAGKLYDPAARVQKSTATLIAMTALDTTNLRLAFTVPANGTVLVRMSCSVAGGTTCPSIVLGVLESATVRWRMTPVGAVGGTIAAGLWVGLEACGVVTGLTPGASLNWDAAYGVENVAASSNINYGGPNDTTTINANGGFAFEIWSTG